MLDFGKLLVTGASGHSAKYFFEKLEQEGYTKKINCLVREKSNTDHLKDLSLNFEFKIVDLDDIETLINSMRDVKVVLHIAHISLSKKILEAGKIAGVDWIICVHTTGRYSKFKSASFEYISIEEELLKEYSNLTILRPTMIYGSSMDVNMWKLINYMNKNKFFPVFGKGKNLMQPVLAKDLGYAYYKILQNRKKTFGKEYNLPGGEKISYISLLKKVASLLDKKIFFIHLPLWFSLLAAYIMNKVFGSRFPISVEQVLRMKEDKVFSFEKANKDFGYSPSNFSDGIQQEVKEFLKQEY